MPAFLAEICKVEGAFIEIQRLLELTHGPVDLVPFHIKIAHKLVKFRIGRSPRNGVGCASK